MAVKTADDCRRHAKRRVVERYGEFLSFDEIKALELKLQNRQGLHLKKESNTRSHWLLEDKYIVVYNKNLRAIVTFLPPDAIINYLPSNKIYSEDVAI
jgi:hypothetical protein